MPTSDTVTDGDEVEKPPAAKQLRGDDHGIQSWEKTTITPTTAPVVQKEAKDEPEIDEFGLPVKPPRRRPNEELSENEDHEQTNGYHNNDVSKRPSVSKHAGEGEKADGSATAESYTGESEPSSATIQDSRLGDSHQRPSPTPGVPYSKSATASSGVSGWSHQALAPRKEGDVDRNDEEAWQDMPAVAQYDLYDDDGRLIARQAHDSDEEANAYTGLGGAGKGYTRVTIDEDAQSATSMDDNTNYLFKPKEGELVNEDDNDDAQRDPLAQMQATKDLLTEGQRIAYVGVTRLAMATMVKELEDIESTKGTKKELRLAVESMKMWSQQMMVRLYSHMEIDSSGNSNISSLIAPRRG